MLTCFDSIETVRVMSVTNYNLLITHVLLYRDEFRNNFIVTPFFELDVLDKDQKGSDMVKVIHLMSVITVSVTIRQLPVQYRINTCITFIKN